MGVNRRRNLDFIGIRAAAEGSEIRLNEALTCPAKPCTCPRVINVTPPSVRGSSKSSGTRAKPGVVIRGSRPAKNNGGRDVRSRYLPYLSIFVAAQDAARISMGLDDPARTYRTSGIIARIMEERNSPVALSAQILSCAASPYELFFYFAAG